MTYNYFGSDQMSKPLTAYKLTKFIEDRIKKNKIQIDSLHKTKGFDDMRKSINKEVNILKKFLGSELHENNLEEIIFLVQATFNSKRENNGTLSKIFSYGDDTKVKTKFDFITYNHYEFLLNELDKVNEIINGKINKKLKELNLDIKSVVSSMPEFPIIQEKNQLLNELEKYKDYDIVDKNGLLLLLSLRKNYANKVHEKLIIDESMLYDENDTLCVFLSEIESAFYQRYRIFDHSYKHINNVENNIELSKKVLNFISKTTTNDVFNPYLVLNNFQLITTNDEKNSTVLFVNEMDYEKYFSKISFENTDNNFSFDIRSLNMIEEVTILHKFDCIITNLWRYYDSIQEEKELNQNYVSKYLSKISKKDSFSLKDAASIIAEVDGIDLNTVLSTIRKISTEYYDFNKYKDKNKNNELVLDISKFKNLLSIYFIRKNKQYQNFFTNEELKNYKVEPQLKNPVVYLDALGDKTLFTLNELTELIASKDSTSLNKITLRLKRHIQSYNKAYYSNNDINVNNLNLNEATDILTLYWLEEYDLDEKTSKNYSKNIRKRQYENYQTAIYNTYNSYVNRDVLDFLKVANLANTNLNSPNVEILIDLRLLFNLEVIKMVHNVKQLFKNSFKKKSIQ